jgi:hypothetical protein
MLIAGFLHSQAAAESARSTFGQPILPILGQKVNDPADVQAIKKLLAMTDKAYASGDADAIVSTYYASNAIRMLSNLPALNGKNAIIARWRSNFNLSTMVWENNIMRAVLRWRRANKPGPAARFRCKMQLK